MVKPKPGDLTVEARQGFTVPGFPSNPKPNPSNPSNPHDLTPTTPPTFSSLAQEPIFDLTALASSLVDSAGLPAVAGLSDGAADGDGLGADLRLMGNACETWGDFGW